MERGIVVDLFIAQEAGAPMERIEAARAVPGRGIEGDRYFYERGSFSRWPGPHREITLIEEEGLLEMEQEVGIRLEPVDSRRNILTRGISLQHLIKNTFTVGSVLMQGIRRCEPCKYLSRRTGKEVIPGMIHRGGLRAQILTEGVIRPGDPIYAVPASALDHSTR